MGKEKNIIIMVKYYLKESLEMDKDGIPSVIRKVVLWLLAEFTIMVFLCYEDTYFLLF